MKDTSCNIRTECRIQSIVLLTILLVLSGSGCRSVSPKLQDEYVRPGLSKGMCEAFDKYRRRRSCLSRKVPHPAPTTNARTSARPRKPSERLGRSANSNLSCTGCRRRSPQQ